MNTQSLIEEIYGLELVGMRLGLEVISKIMNISGNPEKQFKSIHIAGTNGKGSTGVSLSTIYKEAGYKVGFYSSPHIFKFNERIMINGNPISNKELKKEILSLKKLCSKNNIEPTFFEFATALAFTHFAKEKVDIAIIEVGIGGDMDGTNIITPELSLITNIGFDHQQILGNTLLEIASKKAGIIKEYVPLITSEKNPRILDHLGKICKERNSKLYESKDILQVKKIKELEKSQIIKVNNTESYELFLKGNFQIKNIELALAAIEVLQKTFPVKKEKIRTSLKNIKWQGRMQPISKTPLIIIDSAHNKDGFHALAKYMREIPKKKTLLLSLSKNKNLNILLPLAKQFKEVIVSEGKFKPEDPDKIASFLKEKGINAIAIKDTRKACKKGQSELKNNECFLIATSLYMLSDILKYFQENST